MSPDADSSMMIEPDFNRKKNSTVIKDNALVEIKNKLRYPSKAKIESKRPKITSTNENIISYKNSAVPPLKTPRGVNHSFNLDFIRGGS